MAIQIQNTDSFKFTLISGTTNGVINTESAFAHGLKCVPEFYLVMPTLVGNPIYESKPADATSIYLKCATVSVTFNAICISRDMTEGVV